MVDPAIVYTGGVFVLFFFWIYGIVAAVRDVKNYVIPYYRQYRSEGDDSDRADRPAASAAGATTDATVEGSAGDGTPAAGPLPNHATVSGHDPDRPADLDRAADAGHSADVDRPSEAGATDDR